MLRGSERHDFPTLLLVWSFTGTPANTTAADSSLQHCCRRPFGHKARSPQVRTQSFSAQPPHIHSFALATRASQITACSPCLSVPRIRFLSIGSRIRPTLPSHARSPSRSCASLRSLWPARGRTFTSKIAPMLGARQCGAAQPAPRARLPDPPAAPRRQRRRTAMEPAQAAAARPAPWPEGGSSGSGLASRPVPTANPGHAAVTAGRPRCGQGVGTPIVSPATGSAVAAGGALRKGCPPPAWRHSRGSAGDGRRAPVSPTEEGISLCGVAGTCQHRKDLEPAPLPGER